MFRSALLKLTLWYVAVLMTLSLIFSWSLFRIQQDNLLRGLDRQGVVLRQPPLSEGQFTPPNLDQIHQVRQQIIADANRSLIENLILINLGILLASTIGGYLFARRTLLPIQDMLDEQKRFISDASHELRTPLAAMKVEIEIALRDKNMKLAEAKHILHSNKEEVDKLTELSNRLLDLSRLESAPLPQESVDLNQLVGQAQSQIKPLAEHKKQQLIISTPDSPVIIKANPQAIIDTLVIILDNAIKYTPSEGQINLALTTDRRTALLTIIDNGPGIRAVDLPHIFDRFYRADTARTTTQVPGHGLGLSIAKSTIQSHHGTLTAISQRSQGATFTIKLPLA